VNQRLNPLFSDIDGMRQAIVTGPAAGDMFFVDIATGALSMAKAFSQEAMRRGYVFIIEIDELGAMKFANEASERRFREATDEISRDPLAGNATVRPIRSTNSQRNDQPASEGADALMAAIGRLERAQLRIEERFFMHFHKLGGLLHAGTIPSQRAQLVFGAVGRLLSAGHGHASSRLVINLPLNVVEEARQLLTAHDFGATPWQIAEIPLPNESEIEQFLSRAKDRHNLIGNASATATMLALRGYTLTRISETMRALIASGDRNITSIIGGAFNETKYRDAQRRLELMVGLTELKATLEQVAGEFVAVQDALRTGQATTPSSTHMALLGRPGTGKTEVARIIASLLHASGLRRRDVCIRATSADIIRQHNAGEAIQNIRRLMNDAADGVLFIDEAYTLADHEWGRQAIDAMIGEMEERRGSLTVILAGYPNRMRRLFEANDGLKSRIAHTFNLPDYNPDELCEILDGQLKSSSITADADALVAAHAIVKREATRPHENGRDVRNLFEKWNRARLTSGAHRLKRAHIIDPRSPSREDAEQLIRKHSQVFKEMPELEAWMRTTIKTSFDALNSGRLPPAPRLVFSGPPGTGKTTSARQIGKFLRACGVLREGRVIVTSLQNFTSQYIGEASERTERNFRDAAECVLFIDEIYRFVDDQQGLRIIDQIVTQLTNPEYDNVSVIIAGYEERMPDLYRANPGLQDRFTSTLRFSFPATPALASITLTQLKNNFGRVPSEQDANAVSNALERAIDSRRMLPNFAGARTAILIANDVNDKCVARGGGTSIIAADIPAPPPRPPLSHIVAEYRRKYPFADAEATILQDILADINLHERDGNHVGRALGICLTGGPGTGKSTFARWLMHRLSQRPNMAPAPIVECSAQSLQGTYLGQASVNVGRHFEQARGGWLFIDEFHALQIAQNGHGNMYSLEVASQIVAQMTAPQNLSTKVIIAGYPDQMQRALAIDPGLTGRFDRAHELPIPTNQTLAYTAIAILKRKYQDIGGLQPETITPLLTKFFAKSRESEGVHFAGYRCADAFAQSVERNAILRMDGANERVIVELDDILKALRL